MQRNNVVKLCLLMLLFSITLCLCGAAAFAAPINFAGFNMEANGSAGLSGNALRLTPASNSQGGSAFVQLPFQLAPISIFSTQFSFNISGGNGADGFVFVMQNDTRGASALGKGAESFGYGDGDLNNPKITPSFAVEFDTFPLQSGDLPTEHVAIDRDGVVINGALVSADASAIGLRGADRWAWIDIGWDLPASGFVSLIGTIDVYLADNSTKPVNPILAYSFDGTLADALGSQVYLGFSAGTGGLNDNHDILGWTVDGLTTVPTPGALWLLSSGLFGLAGFRRSHFRKR